MLLRLIEDGKPEIFQQQIYDLLGIIANLNTVVFVAIQVLIRPFQEFPNLIMPLLKIICNSTP